MATTLVLKQQCSEFCVSRLLPFMEHSVWILNTCYMRFFFIVLHFCPVWLCTNIWPHTHMELAHQGSYFNQRFRDEPAKSVGIKLHIKNCPIGQYILLACILLNAWSKVNERPHDIALNWMLLVVSVLQKKKR